MHTSNAIFLIDGERYSQSRSLSRVPGLTYPVVEKGNHAIRIHGFTGVEIEVLEAAKEFFGVGLGTLLKGFDAVRVDLLEFSLDCFHITLDMSHIGLLVEWGRLEPEGVNDIVDLRGLIVKSVLLLLGRGVSTCPGSVINPGTRF